jgi:hypothetical protein
MKITKERLDKTLEMHEKHHEAKKEQKLAHAALCKSKADRLSVTDPKEAQHQLNKCSVYKSEAESHGMMQQHFETEREHLAAHPDSHVDIDADVLDEHSDSSRNLQSVAGHDGFLKRIGVLQD